MSDSAEVVDISEWFTKRDCTQLNSMIRKIQQTQSDIENALYYIRGFEESLDQIEAKQKRLNDTLQRAAKQLTKSQLKSMYDSMTPEYNELVKQHKRIHNLLKKEWTKLDKAKSSIKKQQDDYQMCLLKKKLNYFGKKR